MHTISPLPGHKQPIQGSVAPNGVIQVTNAHGAVIMQFSQGTPAALASQIAQAVALARDQGFEMGRAHIRTALGL